MATDAVPARASGDSVIQSWWFGFLVRAALALLAFWALWFAQDRFHAFTLQASANFNYDNSLWLRSVAGATLPLRADHGQTEKFSQRLHGPRLAK